MNNIFTKHPHEVNQTYFQHLRFALKNAITLIFFGLLLIVHALFPFLFENNSRDVVIKMGNTFTERMRSREAAQNIPICKNTALNEREQKEC